MQDNDVLDEPTVTGPEITVALYLKMIESDVGELAGLSRDHHKFWVRKLKQVMTNLRQDCTVLKQQINS